MLDRIHRKLNALTNMQPVADHARLMNKNDLFMYSTSLGLCLGKTYKPM